MKSALPKVLHHVGGAPILSYVLETAEGLQPASITVVLGHQAEEIGAYLSRRPAVGTVLQEPQLGTGHALLQTASVLEGQQGTVVLLSGDVPLLRLDTVTQLVSAHHSSGATATVLTTDLANATGYGRIHRTNGSIDRIIEERDADVETKAIREINSGIFAFDLGPLFPALRSIGSNNAQREYYLPDLISIYRDRGLTVDALKIDLGSELLGVNSREELAAINALLQDQRNQRLMASGVTLIDPSTVWVGGDVEVGQDTVIYPNVYLEGRVRIGSGCELQAGSKIVNSTLADRVLVQNYTIIRDSTVGAGAILGPFTHIRPDSQVEDGAHVGNFVELKKTRLGRGSKANHLAYLGDATIGERVNIGAGVITCNYDGVKKHQTIIEDGAFVGTDSQLVAPVRVGAEACVAAGSSITEDVPPGALAIARSRQVNKDGWKERQAAARAAKNAAVAATAKKD